MVTASNVPSRRCSAGPSGVLTARDATSGGVVMWDERFAGRCDRRRGGDHEQHQPADRDERNRSTVRRTSSAVSHCVDEVVLADGGRRLGQIGGVSRPALDLESPLVIGVEKDRKIQRYEADSRRGRRKRCRCRRGDDVADSRCSPFRSCRRRRRAAPATTRSTRGTTPPGPRRPCAAEPIVA